MTGTGITNSNENCIVTNVFDKYRATVSLGRSNSHLYHYAGNNPVRYVDPEGKSPDIPVSSQEDLWNILSRVDSWAKLCNLFRSSDNGNEIAKQRVTYIFQSAGRQVLEEINSKSNDMTVIALAIGFPEGAAFFGTVANITETMMIADDFISGSTDKAIVEAEVLIAGVVLSKSISYGVGKISSGIMITVGSDRRYYELGKEITNEKALRKLLLKDLTSGYFGNEILPNVQTIVDEAKKIYRKLEELENNE